MTRFRFFNFTGGSPRGQILIGCLILIGIVVTFSSNLEAQVPPPISNDTTFIQDSTANRQNPDSATVFPADRERNFQADTSDEMLDDTLDRADDSLKAKEPREDWRLYSDSLARVEQFIHHREDDPMVDLQVRNIYPLYLKVASPSYKREITFDSLGQTVTIREQVNGLDVKIPITMSTEEYIHRRFEYEQKSGWRMLAITGSSGQTKDDLSNLLGSLTNISITVPANPISNIFGGTENNLRISGGVDIHAAFRNTQTDQQTISRMDQSRNEPDFNQNVQVNVSGTIGKKLNILADWNTQRTFEYENQLKIKYTGFDDEIIQSIEAGNVSLQTPSLVGGGQALFGIKAKMQFGPLSLTALLSQKKGETKEMTISGGSQASDNSIQPHNYSKNHFFLDTLYAKFFGPLHQSIQPTLTAAMVENQVVAIDLYVTSTVRQTSDQGAIDGEAFIDLPWRSPESPYNRSQIPTDTDPKRYKKGTFVKLDPVKDYKIDQYSGVVTLLTSIPDNQALAAEYTVYGESGINRVFGGTVTGDSVHYFKLIRPPDLNQSFGVAWNMMLKNYYPVGATNLKESGFELKLYRTSASAAEQDNILGENLLQVFGLDKYQKDGSPGIDNTFDFINNLTVDADRGEIIFPSLRPFDTTIVNYFKAKNIDVGDSLLFKEIYDTSTTAAAASVNNKYVIKVKAAGSQSSTFGLGVGNLVEGSVRVLLNGTPLTPNVDYTIDYIIGQVVIKKADALLPGANLQIKYEQNDLFQIASKTLMGARAELDAFPNTKLGFTVMNLNQESLSDKVRLGEEPTNNTIIGTDFSTSAELPFLTSAIDALPLIRTKEISTWRLGGEAAYIIPDGNTKKSLIMSDGGASIAYIDDFEGARKTIQLPVNYTGWTLGSVPKVTPLGNVPDSVKMFSKARLIWYNNIPTDVLTQDIWPNRNTRSGQNQVTVLDLDFDPNHRGMYNFSPNLDLSLHRKTIDSLGTTGKYDTASARRKNWNGLMRYIGTIGGNLLEQNISFIEVWMKASSTDIDDLRHGRLYIDLGRVTEDAIPNGILNSEDVIKTDINPTGYPNGILNEGEDVGVDMLGDNAERTTYGNFLTSNAGDPDVSSADPAGDNYVPFQTDLTHVKFNGTDLNKLDPSGLMPNTEDLDGNNSTDLIDQYAEYELPLDTVYYDSTGVLQSNEFHVGGGTNGWYQFRIPLLDAGKPVAYSKGVTVREILQSIQYVRIWVAGFSEKVNIRIAELDLVGNQWLERSSSDSVLKTSVVNIEDNTDYYSEWGQLGMSREKDKTDPNQIIEANEQSLTLIVNDLPPGGSREIYKSFSSRTMDIFNYRAMKMFVHGDKSWTPENAEVYLRFGADTMNYYEYRAPIYPGWNPDRNQMNIIFSQLTAVKAARDSVNAYYSQPVTADSSGPWYGVKGNPSLRQIGMISIGIRNTGIMNLAGTAWINELRLIDIDNSTGMAYRFDTQLKLADLGQIAFNYSRTDPNFHGIDQKVGSRITSVNWAVNANVALERFFPPEWQGTSIPLSYSHSENMIKPKYQPNTDIVVDAASRQAATPQEAQSITTRSQTLNIRDSYAISNFRISIPVDRWYVRETINRLSMSFNYNTTRDRDPSIEVRKQWQWNMRFNYSTTLPTTYFVQPFAKLMKGWFLLDDYKEWKLFYVPVTGFSAGIGGQRGRTYELSRTKGSTLRDTRSFSVDKSFGFGWKFTEGGLLNIAGDYGISANRNLQYLDNDTTGRDLGSILRSFFFGGRDNRFAQKVTLNMKPKVPNILNIPKYFDISGGYGVNYGWQTTLQGATGQSAGWDNNISMSMNFKLKSLTDPWFDTKDKASQQPVLTEQMKRRSERNRAEAQKDTLAKADTTAKDVKPTEEGSNLFSQLRLIGRYVIKYPLLDYESINITYSQTNRTGHAGVLGSTGILNFWRSPFQGSEIRYGPSRLYQLGLISDPHGTLEFTPKSSFPFIGWKTIRGPRAAGLNFTDTYTQGNNLTFRTNRPLWTGASIDFNWKIGWQYSRTLTGNTDNLGNQIINTSSSSGSVERSYLTVPPVLFFKVFKSNLETVGKKYQEYIKSNTADVALAKSFEEGFEALPFLGKMIGQYVPRPNWNLRWDGIEKMVGFTSFMDRLALEHNYTSSFKRDFRTQTNGVQKTDAERMNYGYTPLVGLTMGFKQVLKGNLSGNFRYNATKNYELNVSASSPNIVSSQSQEMAITITYSRHGFSFPLFGLNLSNDVDISASFSSAKTARRRYDPALLTSDQEGVPLDGNTRTSLEPRIRYILSSRVTASIYYKYSKTQPDAGGSSIFGVTSNEAGVDIHISI